MALRRRGSSEDDTIGVLHVVDHFTDAGGAEVSLVQMLPWLQKLGIRNTLLPMHGRWTSTAGPAMAAVGIRVLPPVDGSVVSRVTAVARAMNAFKPDLAHSTMWDADLATRMAGKVTGTPVVTGIINAQYGAEARARARNPRALEVYRRLDAFLARHATFRFHALTDHVAHEAVQALRIPQEKIVVISRGRDRSLLGHPSLARRQAVRESLGIDQRAPVVLNVARQEPQKAISELVTSFTAVLEAHPDAVLLQAGRAGTASGEIKAAVDRLGVGGSVRVLGQRDDVADLLTAADVFATTSHWEGQGGAVLEAMAMEVPTVAYELGPFAESTAGSALLVPIGDITSFGVALCRLLGSPALRADLATAARARFDAKFEMTSVAEQMADFYRATARMAQ